MSRPCYLLSVVSALPVVLPSSLLPGCRLVHVCEVWWLEAADEPSGFLAAQRKVNMGEGEFGRPASQHDLLLLVYACSCGALASTAGQCSCSLLSQPR
jgi:hypothetical protein